MGAGIKKPSGAAGSVLGAMDPLGVLFASSAGREEAEESKRMLKDALSRMENVDLPDYEKMQLALESPELQERFDPQLLKQSALELIESDQGAMSAQRVALEELSELGQTGLGAEDMAAFRELSRGVGAQEQARQASILQQMAQRGTMDSGAQLAAQLSSNQSASNQAAAQADRIAQASAEARRGALSQSANLATQMREQQFGEEAKKASAADLISRFNVETGNQAQMRNISEKQRLEELASATRNQEQMFNKQLGQQEFADKMQKASMIGQQLTGMAQQQQAIASGKAQAEASKQAAGIGAVATVAGGMMSDINLKKHIKEPSSDGIIGKLEKMLDELKAYKYEYKDDSWGKGEHTGVMAQDLEKSELGSEFVKDTDEGKMVEYGKMLPTVVAGLADLHERIKKIEE